MFYEKQRRKNSRKQTKHGMNSMHVWKQDGLLPQADAPVKQHFMQSVPLRWAALYRFAF